jgi:hypothetical protein
MCAHFLKQPLIVICIFPFYSALSVKPRFDFFNSSTTVASFNGKNIRLQCKAIGQPVPIITWYNPQGLNITEGINSNHGSSLITIKTTSDSDYGLYKCKATNNIGSDKHFINVARLCKDISNNKHAI